MKDRSYFPQVLMTATALLLLGLLGGYWPGWVNAAPTRSTSAQSATIGDAVTYQGYLTNAADAPLSGVFTMQFQIYNAKTNGQLLWNSGAKQVTVDDGLFDVRLGITTDIFNGEALWVAQTINGELLAPRQEILPARWRTRCAPVRSSKARPTHFPTTIFSMCR
ncbi:MAG: hypothetical protein HC802_04055 [Caldilineaceae bacterium]|nr:hypothetical protein [Caldilineaceae bacterium]